MSWLKRITRKRKLATSAAGVVLATALVAQLSVVSNASWNDSEAVHAPEIGTSDCSAPKGAFATRSEGKLISGSLLGIPLETVADVRGVTTTNNGSDHSQVVPAGTPETPVGSDAYSNPLNISAVNIAHLDVTGLLELPLDTQTGVVGQYSQAVSNGQAVAASGTVADDGGISLEQFPGDVPDLATLKLSDLLNAAPLGSANLGTALAGVSDLELVIGAVGAEARLNGCEQAWAGASQSAPNPLLAAVTQDIITGLEREYLVASANLSFKSDAVGSLVSAIGGTPAETCSTPSKSTVKSLECAVNSVATDAGVLSRIRTGVTTLLGTLTSGLGLGAIDVALTTQMNFSAVQAMLDDTLADSNGVLTINLGDGSVGIDTVALLHAADPVKYSNGLNGLPPNTNPLEDEAVLTELTSVLTHVLGDWIERVSTALLTAVNDTQIYAHVKIHLTLRILLGESGIGHIEAVVGCPPTSPTPASCSLATLLDPQQNTNVTKAEFKILPGLANIPILGPALLSAVLGLVDTVLAGLVGLLITGLGNVVGTAVTPALDIVRDLAPTLNMLTQPLGSAITNLYEGLYLSDILSVTVNAQNSPAAPGGPSPVDWELGKATAPPDGQYDVAAMRIGVFDALPEGVRLYLGRASVGPGCSPAAVAAAGCTTK